MSKRIHPIITSADVRQDHTPGPWSERDCEIQAADGSPICEMLARPEDKEKWGRHHADANSRLIAAAPDLLTLCKRLVETATLCRDCEWEVLNHELIQLLTSLESEAMEAIAKAGGAK